MPKTVFNDWFFQMYSIMTITKQSNSCINFCLKSNLIVRAFLSYDYITICYVYVFLGSELFLF